MITRAPTASTEDADAPLARVAAERRRCGWQRVGATGLGAVALTVVLGWPGWLLLIFAYFVAQALELWAFAPVRRQGAFPTSIRRKAALASLSFSAVVYGAASLAVALIPGKGSLALAFLMLLAAGVNSLPVSLDSRRAFVALVWPLLAYAIAVPAIALWADGPSPLLLLNTLAGLLFLSGAAQAWRACDRKLQESRWAQAELEDRRAEAEAATAAKSAFVAMVSHELRTPLSGVMAAGDELQRRLEKDENREAAAVLVDAGRFMKTLLDDLLDLAKLEAGRMTVETVEFDLGHLIWSQERHWTAAARGAGKPLQLASAFGLPVRVAGDPTRLRQILNNLLSNALKFTGPEGVSWTVDACEGPDGHSLTVRVVDTGPGMGAEQLQRLFTAFDQTDESVARTHGGTGLGLAVSRELARAMGGDLAVQSERGRGSTFTLCLPLKRAAKAAPAVKPAAAVEAPARALRLLVVDDHPINRRTLALLLEPSGAEVSAAETAAEALALLAAEPFDAVLSDVNMPEMDGLSFTRTLRGTTGPNRETPVIAVTGGDGDRERADCRAAGMAACVAKPIDAGALYAALEAALGGEAEAEAETRAA